MDSSSIDSYPKDYKTSLNAVTGIGDSSTGTFTGYAPIEPRWTFTVEPISAKSFEINNQVQFGWLENVQ